MASRGDHSNFNTDNVTRNITALIVDDDNTCRTALTIILSSQGFETYGVKSAKEAIDLFREGREFDVVFMDIIMPVMKGIQATRELREMGVTCMIVGLEVDIFHGDVQELIDAGMDRFYVKPISCISAAVLHQELLDMKNDQ